MYPNSRLSLKVEFLQFYITGIPISKYHNRAMHQHGSTYITPSNEARSKLQVNNISGDWLYVSTHCSCTSRLDFSGINLYK